MDQAGIVVDEFQLFGKLFLHGMHVFSDVLILSADTGPDLAYLFFDDGYVFPHLICCCIVHAGMVGGLTKKGESVCFAGELQGVLQIVTVII